jgi:glucose/arabinose dehydrogenase
MRPKSLFLCGVALAALTALLLFGAETTQKTVRTGKSAFASYKNQEPGVRRKITVADLPPPFATESVRNHPKLIPRPEGAQPRCLAGFRVSLYAKDLEAPRLIRTAPNGDFFVAQATAESGVNNILVFRGISAHGKPERAEVFATGLKQPFGIAFYPPGPNPKYIYVANTDSVIRFLYKNGDLKARGSPETIVSDIPGGGKLAGGGHWTRDIVFSRDGKKMFVSVGSHSNLDDTDNNPVEKRRADILEFNPDGSGERIYAWGIRNPVGLAINPQTGELWASVNERDTLGDNLVPDYITHIKEGGFYGWPWFYVGPHQDPHFPGKHPELKSKVLVPDVLLQPHNASIEMTFYEGPQFAREYQGDIFAAEHGSWNKAERSGYEIVRVPLKNGRATGEYEDFLTGFVTAGGQVWGRPAGVTIARDGSMLVTDDGSKTIWLVRYEGGERSKSRSGNSESGI